MCDKVARERWCVAKKGPFCTKQTKDINVRCNRLYSSLHTQVSHAASTHALKGVNNIISKQKRLDNIARPKLLRTPCWRRSFSRQQIVPHTYSKTKTCTILYNHISSKNISCPQGISVTVMRTAPLSSRVTSSRCLAAMRATCKESGHAKKHAETCKHRLHKVSFYDCTAKTSSLFDLCASSNSKHAGTVSSSANLYKA